jgi:ribonuclease P/MRP protein subunit POP5
VLLNFGDAGWGAVGYSLTGTYRRPFYPTPQALISLNPVKYYSPTTNLCIIRIGREHVRTAWGAVTLLSSIEGRHVIPNVIHVSGSVLNAACYVPALIHSCQEQ